MLATAKSRGFSPFASLHGTSTTSILGLRHPPMSTSATVVFPTLMLGKATQLLTMADLFAVAVHRRSGIPSYLSKSRYSDFILCYVTSPLVTSLSSLPCELLLPMCQYSPFVLRQKSI